MLLLATPSSSTSTPRSCHRWLSEVSGFDPMHRKLTSSDTVSAVEGATEGEGDGARDGVKVGAEVGSTEGTADGKSVGVADGMG